MAYAINANISLVSMLCNDNIWKDLLCRKQASGMRLQCMMMPPLMELLP